ncbi:MAG: DUF4346 domain-containing protein [Acidobacteriota bacterium]|nr:MAG: DUF4346 domain-containing protein [Acidobacteriota bacterium]
MTSALIHEIATHIEATARAEKCHACGCFHDAVAALETSSLASSLTECLAGSQAVIADRRYDCLGCEICWPALAINLAEQITPLPVASICPAERARPTDGWPPLAGEYQVVRYMAPVAVCTLHSRELNAPLRDAAPASVSIIGSLQTENLGIERIIENVSTNPNIRFLVLCGEDSPGRVGHLPGQTMLALASDGIDEQRHIRGANGKRPVLANIDRAILEHFLTYVELIDARGLTDASEISQEVSALAERDPGPAPFPAAVRRRVPVQRSAAPGDLVLDPAGYIVITPDRRRSLIVVEHYDHDGVLRGLVEGRSAIELAATLVSQQRVTRPDHAAYLGRELTLAESALREGRPYVQDRAPERRPAEERRESRSAGGSCSCEEDP